MAKSQPTSTEVFDLARIRSLVELMKEHDLHEVDLRQAEQQIRICRNMAGVAPAVTAQPVAHVATPVASVPAAPATPAAEGKNIAYIKSPMVGTFYSKPNPKADSFIKVGDHVDAEKTVCIIEAMKVFNEIPAEIKGKILAVLVEEEEPVEFGKPLFKVDTSA